MVNEAAIGATLESLGVPTLATLEGEATAEGGDLLWLDHDTLAVGRVYRTNAEGLRQLTAALRPIGVETFEVQLPVGTPLSFYRELLERTSCPAILDFRGEGGD